MESDNANGHDGRRELELALEHAAQQAGQRARRNSSLHPAWETFIDYCRQLGHGELERLKIQNGLPILAEVTTRKVKFS